MAKLSDSQIHAFANSELQSATAWYSSELSHDRAKAMEYYLGEPYGDEKDGRSQVRTREVLDTIEWILPSLLRIFAEQTNAAEFVPIGPEDQNLAEQETDTVSHVYWA